jgi:hypothetical protein
MDWIASAQIKKARIGVDVLVQTGDGQYMAGTFHRTASGMNFKDNTGAWTISISEITRFVYIEG